MRRKIYLGSDARRVERRIGGQSREIAAGIAYLRTLIANVVLFGPPAAGDRGWVLIDAGVYGTKSLIKAAAESRFGKAARPAAIILTHGHFDHVGVLEDLAAEWDAPVYAHPLEHPFLDGSTAYPAGDPSVGGGMISRLSSLYPTKPVNVSARLRSLLSDGSVPEMPGWRWIHTPGHAPGHVSLWRERDRTLIVGDAFVTTTQESLFAVLAQTAEMHGPPMYFTTDWDAAADSVRRLAELGPDLVVTGHGRAMQGPAMRDALTTLAENFRDYAVPKQGRYVRHPATSLDGSVYRKPR